MLSSADVQTSGNSLPAAVALAQAGDELLVGQRAGLEELLHQLLVGLGDHLDERLARRVDRRRSCRPGPAPSVNLPLSSVWKTNAFLATRSTTPRNAFSSPIGS